MNEEQWLSCTDPWPMLNILPPSQKGRQRQLRLFSLACCYRISHLLPTEGRRLLDVSDRFGEGTATRNERDVAVAAFRRAHGRFGSKRPPLRAVYYCKDISFEVWTADLVARNAALAVEDAAGGGNSLTNPVAIHAAEKQAQAHLLRDICGPLLFRPAVVSQSVLAWNDATVVRLAQGIYEERTFGRLPILADALLDAGCDNVEILQHCREQGALHTRGCWVLDLLLGKS